MVYNATEKKNRLKKSQHLQELMSIFDSGASPHVHCLHFCRFACVAGDLSNFT